MKKRRQLTDTILMIRPSHFGYNPETGKTNTFQTKINEIDSELIRQKAQNEFDAMVDVLRKQGIQVLVIDDEPSPVKPDAVFPNNWISFHQDGTVVTYPMQTENRRIERREDLIEIVSKKYQVSRRYLMEVFEEKSQFLEGTGSMIFDHENSLVYACLSPRTDVRILEHFGNLMQYTPIYFHSYNESGVPVYHTNVMMALGVDFVVICLESVPVEERQRLFDSFANTRKEIIEITLAQMNQFAGNMLQVQSSFGDQYLIMSQSAYNSLREEQIMQLEKFTRLLPIAIPTIETIGGGSVRCMMAEVFLPKL
ncbi:MAG: amidinotransferase [Saprospiraceae bacterium]|nr:amidinotransferase [Saprospiraceae bacterium]